MSSRCVTSWASGAARSTTRHPNSHVYSRSPSCTLWRIQTSSRLILIHLVPRFDGRAQEAPQGADALRKTRETLLFLFPHRRRTFTRRRTACSLSSSSSSLRPPPSCHPDATWPTTVSFWGKAKQHHRCDGWTVTHGHRLILITGLSLTIELLRLLPLHPLPTGLLLTAGPHMVSSISVSAVIRWHIYFCCFVSSRP